jgi:hypothetical protein
MYDYNIIVSDDSSPDIRYKEFDKYLNTNVKVIKTKKNNGKKKYWLTINNVLSIIKDYKFDILIQLDDDFEICQNFLDKTIKLFIDNRFGDDKISAMSLHLNNELDLIDSRWGLGNSWVDGGAIYTKEILIKLRFKINKINQNRWLRNEKLSSGVWQQVSSRINQMGYYIIKPKYSFLNHNDNGNSEMNGDIRIEKPINTYNFIDDFEDEIISIFKITNNSTTSPLNISPNKDWWIKKRTL